MVNRPRGQRHFTIRHTPDYSGRRRMRPWMFLPLAGAVAVLGFSGMLDKRTPPAAPYAPEVTLPQAGSVGASDALRKLAGPGELREIIDSLGEAQWGQETLDRAAVLHVNYLLGSSNGYLAASNYLELLLSPTHPDQVEEELLQELAKFLEDDDPQATQTYRDALGAVYYATQKGTD